MDHDSAASEPPDDGLMPIPPRRDRLLAVVCVLGIIICFCMGLFELSRAFEGVDRAWAYTFEWPIFAVFIIWIWRRLQRQWREEAAGQPSVEDPGPGE